MSSQYKYENDDGSKGYRYACGNVTITQEDYKRGVKREEKEFKGQFTGRLVSLFKDYERYCQKNLQSFTFPGFADWLENKHPELVQR